VFLRMLKGGGFGKKKNVDKFFKGGTLEGSHRGRKGALQGNSLGKGKNHTRGGVE